VNGHLFGILFCWMMPVFLVYVFFCPP